MKTLMAAQRSKLALLLCLSVLLAVACGFTSTVLSRPHRTPILTLSGVYGPEWDLNAWVAEDLAAIRSLDKSTYDVEALPSAVHLAGGLWDAASETIGDALSGRPAEVPLVLYVNLHGAINDQGQACVIPPGGAPDDASSWLPLADLLGHLEKSQAEAGHRHPVILILECGKLTSHWPAGITVNRFSDHLDDLAARHVRKHPGASLAVLSSSATAQRSLASRRGTGDVFTQFVVQGLRGDADGAFAALEGRWPRRYSRVVLLRSNTGRCMGLCAP